MVLKTRFTSGVSNYIDLGDCFQEVDKMGSPEDFDKTCKVFFGENVDLFLEKTTGFIVHEGGVKIEPIYRGFDYHILSNDGRLFRTIQCTP